LTGKMHITAQADRPGCSAASGHSHQPSRVLRPKLNHEISPVGIGGYAIAGGDPGLRPFRRSDGPDKPACGVIEPLPLRRCGDCTGPFFGLTRATTRPSFTETTAISEGTWSDISATFPSPAGVAGHVSASELSSIFPL
jgi:hypothetical protein